MAVQLNSSTNQFYQIKASGERSVPPGMITRNENASQVLCSSANQH